jgi:flagellar biosynthesis/type III secretory pathway M-ring protein FliF/YscJ
MSGIGAIGILAAIGFLFAVFLAFIKGVIEQLRTHNKKPKKPDSKPKLSNNSETKNSEDSEHDVTYGEDSFEQEDDEFHEEIW